MGFTPRQWDIEQLFEERPAVLSTWPTGREVGLEEAFGVHAALPKSKVFSEVLRQADQAGQILLQPRAGVALVDEHIKLLKYLESEADLLPTTVDAYTRQNRYQEAQEGIQRSLKTGSSMLNGFPIVNHGVRETRRLIDSLGKPLQVRHGTPDARLLAEISLAAGFTSFEGGGISYNIPYAKRISLKDSLHYWRYVDRLTGWYEQNGCPVNREPFGPLSGTLIPPFISHVVAILEGLLALEQGVRSLTLGYGQGGNLIQDIAAIRSLRTLADQVFQQAGFKDYHLTTVFHQWMGGFPPDESNAYSVIALGAAVGCLAGANKTIVKTPHEALGIPTMQANLNGLKATRQIVSMLRDQRFGDSEALSREIAIITREVQDILGAIWPLCDGDLAQGISRSFEAGILDIPFAPSVYNSGKLLPVRDNSGAIRVLENGAVPLSKEVLSFHSECIAQREKQESRTRGFQMVIDDIYAVSKGRLVGRPR